MKIAMLGHKRIPSREGGIEVVVEELSTRMALLGNQVTCYNRKGHHVSDRCFDMPSPLSAYRGVQLKNVPTIDKKGMAAVTASMSASVLAALGNYDVVHYHAEGPSAMCWLPKLFGKKVIVTIHGLDHQRAKWGKFASSYIKHGERNAVKYADEIIVLSKNIQKYFQETYHRHTVMIPNGVKKQEQKAPHWIRSAYGLAKDEYLLFLGRIVPEKGIEYLIHAFRAIETEKKLVIAGGSSDTKRFEERLHQLCKGDERIVFTGFVQGEALAELYSNAYLYVLPSDVEGMPLSLLEAMSYGNCCLVSDIPECQAVVEDYGYTFKHGDAGDLANQLQLLCQSEELVKKQKKKSQNYIVRKYNWDSVVAQTLALYEKN